MLTEVDEQVLAVFYVRDFALHLNACLYPRPARVRIDPPLRSHLVGGVSQVRAVRRFPSRTCPPFYIEPHVTVLSVFTDTSHHAL